MTAALSPRERQVLLEIALNGGTDAEIAERLGMSRNTLRTHVQHLHAKTGTHSKLELALLVWKTGRPEAQGDGVRGHPGL